MIDTIILAVILLFVMALFFLVQKGFNQVITGLNAIHEQLRKLEGKK
jgi:hypothetical protein